MPYIGRGSDGFGIRERYQYTATSGQTAFTGSDINSKTLKFDNGSLIDVLLNGVMLKPTTDWTSSGSTVTLTSGASTSDEVMIIVYDVFVLSDAMPKTGGTFSGALAGVDVNGTELILDADGDSSITADTDDVMHFKLGGTDKVSMGGANSEMDLTGSLGLRIIKASETNYSIVAGDDGIATHMANRTDGTSAHGQIVWNTRDGGNTLERMRINASGNLAFPTGKGIDFSATSDADSSAGGTYVTESEVLDDYEEGRFTPAFHATNVTWSHNHQYGNYTKVGQIVHFTIYIAVSSASGSTTNQAYVWGLPYTCYDGTTSGRYSPAVTIGSWYNGDIDPHFPTAYIDPNTDIIKLVHQQDASTPTAVTCDDVKGNSYIYLSGSYRIT